MSTVQTGRAVAYRVALIALLVFAACLLGILTRLPGTLAAFWPANALLLGVIIRFPKCAPLAAWPVWLAAYLAADLVTGGSLVRSLALNTVNLVGVAAGYYLFRRFPLPDRTLGRVRSVVFLVAMAATAALAAGVAGGLAHVWILGQSWGDTVVFWTTTELVHYLTITPLAMTCPPFWRRTALPTGRELVQVAGAITTLVVCLVMAVVIGGTGALAFPVPVLVVTALLTTVFITALCTALAAAALMLLNAHGLVGLPTDVATPVSVSVQIGLALLAVGPIAVACVMAERHRLLDEVRRAGTVDDLTAALRRDEFYRLAENSLAASTRSGRPVAVLLIDLDHFKNVNDALGHRAGDGVLRDFADRVRDVLRPGDHFGRLGGEEFAVLIPDIELEVARTIAERLRVAQQDGAAASFGVHGPTISIGVGYANAADTDLEQLLDIADAALYQAKKDRNATVVDSITD
ncbi:diguanylate cyclase [Mycobacterium sp. C31M]